jgi:hypothetical protein
MDFIERLLGVSPDGGDGSTEVLWLAVLAIAIAAWVFFRVRRGKMRVGARRTR